MLSLLRCTEITAISVKRSVQYKQLDLICFISQSQRQIVRIQCPVTASLKLVENTQEIHQRMVATVRQNLSGKRQLSGAFVASSDSIVSFECL